MFKKLTNKAIAIGSSIFILCITLFAFGGRSVYAATLPGAYMSGISHPVSGAYNAMLTYDQRIVLRETSEEKSSEVSKYIDMSREDFLAEVQSRLPLKINSRSNIEINICRMAQIYRQTAESEAKKALGNKIYESLILFASNDLSLNIDQSDYTNDCYTHIPSFLVMAYDCIYDINTEDFDIMYEIDTRALIEQYFYNTAQRVYTHFTNNAAGNFTGYTVKNMVGLATVMNNPEIMRWAIYIVNKIAEPSLFYGDGMWWEGSISYCTQVYANIKEAIPLITSFTDPDGYIDEASGISLDGAKISSMWNIFDYASSRMPELIHPDSTKIAVNDTHPTYSTVADKDLPIEEKGLNNVEFNHFGLFSIKNGDTTDAQSVTLNISSVFAGTPFGGGHYHGDSLSMSLWAGHQELLPDSGYPYYVENNRYFHMSPVTHNNSWIWSSDHNYTEQNFTYSKPKLLRYDDGKGEGNNGFIQLIEAGIGENDSLDISDKRRLLMQIKTSENTSYVLDVQTLQGGEVHENFLRASEDEASVMSLETQPVTTAENLGNYLSLNGMNGLMAQQTLFKDASIYDGNNDVAFTWTGETSGAVLSAYVKGVPNSVSAFSKMPTLRRTGGDVNKKNDYPNYHFYQRREVSGNEKTHFAAVYEGISSGNSPKVFGVDWFQKANSVFAVVDLGKTEDIICISENNDIKYFDGLTFSTEIGWVRRNKESKTPVFGYIYGGGSIYGKNYVIYCEDDFNAVINNAERVPFSDEFNIENEITHEKNMLTLNSAVPSDLVGRWGVINFYDGSGVAHRIESVNDYSVAVHNDLGFEITDGKVRFITYPAKVNSNGSVNLTNVKYSNLSDRVGQLPLTYSVERTCFDQPQPMFEFKDSDNRIVTRIEKSGTYYVSTALSDEKYTVFVVVYYSTDTEDEILYNVLSFKHNGKFNIPEKLFTQEVKDVWVECLVWDDDLKPLCEVYELK